MNSNTVRLDVKTAQQKMHGISLENRALKAANRDLQKALFQAYAAARTQGFHLPADVIAMVEGRESA